MENYLQKMFIDQVKGSLNRGGVSSWDDLTDKPAFVTSYTDLTDQPIEQSWVVQSRVELPTTSMFIMGLDNIGKDRRSFHDGSIIEVGVGDEIFRYDLNAKYPSDLTIGYYKGCRVYFKSTFKSNGTTQFRSAVIMMNTYSGSVSGYAEYKYPVTEPIDEKYLPESVMKADELSAVATSGSWDDLTDKPFGDATPAPITWDSNIDGKEVVYGGETALAGTSMWFVKLGDWIPLEHALGAVGTLSDTQYGEGIEVQLTEDIILTASDLGCDDVLSYAVEVNGMPGAVSIHTDSNIHVSNGLTADCHLTAGFWCCYTVQNDKVGLYVSSVAFPEQIKKIDEKYLPDNIARISKVQELINASLGVIENGSY